MNNKYLSLGLIILITFVASGIGSFVTSNDQIKEFFDDRGISLDQRPQEISPSNWFALAKTLKETCFIENGPFQSK